MMAVLSEPKSASNAAEKLCEFLASIAVAAELNDEGYAPYISPEDCAVLMHIHILGSSVGLIKSLIDLKFDANSIVLVPKIYSTITAAQDAVECLGGALIRNHNDRFPPGHYDYYAAAGLRKGIKEARSICRDHSKKRCILVDDGGFLTEQWSAAREDGDSFDAVSIQQTASGLFSNRTSLVRRINVGGSAAKRHFESKIIVAGVLKKLASLRMLYSTRNIAVIGLGSVGMRVASELAQNHRIFTFDTKVKIASPRFQHRSSWQKCVSEADIILGCTGRNFMHFEVMDLAELGSGKVFLSLSSRDVEFKSLLLADGRLDPIPPFRDLRIRLGRKYTHLVANSGFPINFDRKLEWETPEDIWLTRGLVLIAILQALSVAPRHDTSMVEKLALRAQRDLVLKWLKARRKDTSDFEVSPPDFGDSAWWHRESKGSVYKGKWHSGDVKQLGQYRHNR
jgi:hypothetical protein